MHAPLAATAALLIVALAFAAPATADHSDEVNIFGLQIIDEDPASCDTFAMRLQDVLADDDQLDEEHIVFDILVAADPSYIDLHGAGGWQAAADAQMALANAVYEYNFDMSLSVAGYAAIPAADIDYTRDGTRILDDMADYFQANTATYDPADRDAVLLLIGEDVAGATAGQVACVGGAQSALVSSYGWAEAFREFDQPIDFFGVEFLGFGDGTTIVITHELAHLLGAHHHYANCAESAPFYDPAFTSLACTTMINAIDMATLKFSTTNVVQVRSFAEHWDL